MDRSILQKHTARLETDSTSGGPFRELAEDIGCFGWMRTRDRCPMLELWKKSGNCLAISYSYIERIEFDPSTGILIVAGPTRVEIQGQGLNTETRPGVRLFEGLARHRVPWVRESRQEDSGWGNDSTYIVDHISW